MTRFEKVSINEFYKSMTAFYHSIGVEARDTFRTVGDMEDMYVGIELPTRATAGSSGYDIRIPFDLDVKAGKEYKIPTGIKFQVEGQRFLMILPRSSMGMKYGLFLLNTVPDIDADYYGNPSNEGHIFLAFRTTKDLHLKAGDRIAQGIIASYTVTDDDNASGERTGGMGSTGKQ